MAALAPDDPLLTVYALVRPTELPEFKVNVLELYTVEPLTTKLPPTTN
jgi:hypothetical protein